MIIETLKVVNFGKNTDYDRLPSLIQIQTKSFHWFLQIGVSPEKRKRQGLQQVFKETFPIESPNGDIVLEFVKYEIGDPKRDVADCRERGVTYAAPLKATIRLITRATSEVREQSVFLGDLPVMTTAGTFIINGAERVVVSQVHRSPGIFFFNDRVKKAMSCRVIPYRGSWLEFEMDKYGIIVSRIDRKKKFPATMLIKALGYDTNEDIIKLLYDTSDIKIAGKTVKDLKPLIGKRTAVDIVNSDGELILEAGEKINEDNIDLIREMQIKNVCVIDFENNRDEPALFACLEKDPSESAEDALLKFHSLMRPGEPSNLEYAQNEINRLFFSTKSYDLGEVGRYKINNKFLFHDRDNFENVKDRVLRKIDIIDTIKYFLGLIAERQDFLFDDIDHLGNRRIRSVGELLMNQVKIGFARTERVIKERMTVQDIDVITPQALISIKPITAVINEFFGSSQLSQFMDQTNPLSELTHKRRLNALGPGGLSRERAGFEVRDVHYSHYGRMCPIETPEGPNIGLNVSLASFAQVNQYGFLETPYQKVIKGKVTEEIEFLTADIEDHYSVAQAGQPLKEDGAFINQLIPCRNRSDFPMRKPEDVNYIDLAPMQIVSISTSMIPFLEHDDANRALMGSNMQRQAVPLMIQAAPYVGTGMENKAAYDSSVCIVSKTEGYISKVDANHIEITDAKTGEIDQYPLTKFKRSNQGTYNNQTPRVYCYNAPFDGTVSFADEKLILTGKEEGQKEQYILEKENITFHVDVKDKQEVYTGDLLAGMLIKGEKLDKSGKVTQKGTIIADGTSCNLGKLSLGKNLLVAFMPWEGYNFEDAILISENVVKDDVFTSIHIEEFEIGARETKLGREMMTRDIPNLSDKAFRDLNEDGIIRIGAEVQSGDILVGMVTPKGETDLTPEYKLLHSIFGEKAKEVRDSSLVVPNGVQGIVIDIKQFSREEGDELPAGVEEMVKVYIATKRKLKVGDKLAGRHGNKGVVSRIMAEEDMPFREDGTPVDIVLNPLGVPSRMNLGQILESQLGYAAHTLGIHFETPIFDGASEEDIHKYVKEAGLPVDGRFLLRDGRTGEKFLNNVFCGYIYMIKLHHMVDDKIHARSTGPYSLVTQQPLGGKAQFGGQRLGEMEVWALEAYGASYTLQELLTVKSDDMLGRARIYEAIVKGIHSIKPGIPESFNVLVQELRGLALDISIFDSFGNEVILTDYDDDYSRAKRKIKIESIENKN